jgi:SAM-dependent methyltransferase
MAYYDNFVRHSHPRFAQQILLHCNVQTVKLLLRGFSVKQKHISLLEIGPGKGYFYQALKQVGKNRVEYHCCDQNTSVLEQFPVESRLEASVPPLPETGKRFDIIYAAYVIEHLAGGKQVYDFVESCGKNLKPGGVLVLLAPDSCSQGFEFWNMDYTHSYPTTMRNVAMILRENNFSHLSILPVNGLLTVPGFEKKSVYWILRMVFLGYQYRIFHAAFSWIFGKPIYDLDNPFYQAFCFAKQRNLMFIARK